MTEIPRSRHHSDEIKCPARFSAGGIFDAAPSATPQRDRAGESYAFSLFKFLPPSLHSSTVGEHALDGLDVIMSVGDRGYVQHLPQH